MRNISERIEQIFCNFQGF